MLRVFFFLVSGIFAGVGYGVWDDIQMDIRMDGRMNEKAKPVKNEMKRNGAVVLFSLYKFWSCPVMVFFPSWYTSIFVPVRGLLPCRYTWCCSL